MNSLHCKMVNPYRNTLESTNVVRKLCVCITKQSQLFWVLFFKLFRRYNIFEVFEIDTVLHSNLKMSPVTRDLLNQSCIGNEQFSYLQLTDNCIILGLCTTLNGSSRYIFKVVLHWAREKLDEFEVNLIWNSCELWMIIISSCLIASHKLCPIHRGNKRPIECLFFFFYCSVELISASAQYTTLSLAASSSLSILLVRHFSHGYYCG